jgi:hypothetical protein
MTFALLYDGLCRYIEEETALLLHPELAEGVLRWLNDLMPLPKQDLSRLMARVDTGDERVRAVLRRYRQLYVEYHRVRTMDDDTLPAILKITARHNLLFAACLLLVTMSTTLYQIREGISV